MANVKHSSKHAEHPTPLPYIAAAKSVMGQIDCDPASTTNFNTVVGARRIYTAEDSGLDIKACWNGSVFLNPPGTCRNEAGVFTVCGKEDPERKVCSCRLVRQFWHRLETDYSAGIVDQAIWIGFSIEQLQTLQLHFGARRSPLSFPICYPRRRIPFTGTGNTHASFIAYLPRSFRGSTMDAELRFADNFKQFGGVVCCSHLVA